MQITQINHIKMSDGIHTEILSGLAEGTEIVTTVTELAEEEPAAAPQEKSPFAPGPPSRKKK